MKFAYFLVLTWIGLFQSASAQTMKAINLEPGDKLINQGVNISIDFTSEKKPWCGLRVDWGNGKTQPVRVGHDGDEGAPTSPIKLSNTYNTAGKYNISVKGELLVRGLTGSALPCEVSTNSIEVVIIDPIAERQFIQKAWSSYFASLESRPLQLQCVKIGVSALGIKSESTVSGDKLTSMEAPIAKTLIERCMAFQQAKKPEVNGPCKIASGNNFFDSICDGYYAEKQANGALKLINVDDALNLQIQGKPWVIGFNETESGKSARLVNEIEFKEKERQRALEAERQKAAELQAQREAAKQLAIEEERQKVEQLKAQKEAEKQLAIQQERQKVEQLAAKKAAEAKILPIWRDTGFENSKLPFCLPTGEANNCFGSGSDSGGNEYFGEFKNNMLFGRGVVIYKNGDRYVGEFDKAPNGQGIYYYLRKGTALDSNQFEGWIFVGEFKNNAHKGNGIYFNEKRNVVETGIYDNSLKEYRYVDPTTFSRIPANKIPVISADARALIEKKQAEIAFAAKPKPGQRSVSGKPQDEAYCKMLGDPRITDKKCLPSDPEEFVIRKTTFQTDYEFGDISDTDDSLRGCELSEVGKPLIKYLKDNKIQYILNTEPDGKVQCVWFQQEDPACGKYRHKCKFAIAVDVNDLPKICSPPGRRLFFNRELRVNVNIGRLDIRDNFETYQRIQDDESICR